MPTRTVIQPGRTTECDLFVYAHIAASAEIKAQAAKATDDAVFTELWGNGTGAYRPLLPSMGGRWTEYVRQLSAANFGSKVFRYTTLTTWSAGSQVAKDVCNAAVLRGQLDAETPDALVMLDGLYGAKPAGSRQGDGKVVWDSALQAIGDYAIAAAEGRKVCVILHSNISTPYASSKECVEAVLAYVQTRTGQQLQRDPELAPADLAGQSFVEALRLGNLHVVEFAGRDAAEHMREAHLFDEVWRRWVPWVGSAPSPRPPAPLPPAPGTPRPTLRKGDKGPHVGRLQSLLGGLKVDDDFGTATETRLRAWQRDHGLTADGIAGQKTWTSLGETWAGPATAPGHDPRAAACVAALRDANEAWPGRDRRSDGVMGDARHQAKPSDHNLGNAVDITHDPEAGADGDRIARLALRDPRTKYVIWNRRIWSNELHDDPSGPGRPYAGDNQHTHHVHISVRADRRDDAQRWPWMLN